MATTTMHFGPEWMRTKHQPPPRPQPSASPPPTSAAPSSGSTYSALVSPAAPPQPDKRDDTHPFRYTKEEMLRIYKEGGGRGSLGLEVERWDGVVREVGSEPVGLRDMGDAEKKLFAGPLNSELRRRQSTDYLSPLVTTHPGDRPRLNHNNSGTGSPMRERFGGLMGRRKDSTDPPLVTIPRKTSLSGGQPPLPSRETGLPSPRNRAGFGPSFDGVLNGPESWTSRRRATEGLSKAEAAISPQGDREDGERLDGKDSDIKEEDEDRLEERLDSAQNDVLVIPASQQDVSGDGSRLLDMQPVDRNSANSSIAGRNIPETSNTATMDLASAPPGIPDLASVEWSYLDPQGQVQGPFRADVMQKWYDEGYFSIDLLMKRTHSDIEWTPVGELARRTEGEKIFLSPLTSSLPPPGLARRNETPLQIASPSTDQSGFNSAYQPAPARPLRASTLDSFVSNASNPSDSPSSSFGVGRYGSPDPSAFGGRAAGNPYPIKESSVGRVGSFQSVSDPQPPFPSVRRGGVFNDLVPEPSLGRTPSFGNIAPGRGSTVDNFGGFEGGYSSNQPWSPSSGNAIEPNFDTMPVGRGTMETGPFMSNMGSTNTLHQSVAFNQRGHQDPGFNDGSVGAGFNSSAYNAMNDLAPPRDVQQASRPMVDDGMVGTPGFGYNYVNDFRNAPLGGFQGQQYPNTSSVSHIPSQQILRAPPTLGQAPSNPILEASNRDSFLQSPNVPPSPWTAEPPTRRPGPFDPLHPTVKNTAVPPRSITPSQPPWTRTSQNSPSDTNVNEASPWFTASQNAPDDTWKDISAPHSLTFSNVGQHNQQQQEQKSIRLSDNRIPVPATAELETATAPIPIAAVIEPKPAAPASGSTKRRKSNTTHAQAISVEVPLPPTKGPSPPPSAGHVKPAWSNEDEAKKSKPSGLAQGLREIQEAEAKKAEAKKAAERERERAARHATAPTTANEESQPFIASWGLPTSQAGSARTSNNQKDPPGAAPSHPNAPVWTTTGKSPATKKTMKEIQEEEETRKKLAVKETVATAAARRAYAETTNKVVSTAPSSGGAWTTVGASGKPSSAILNPTRPSITPSTSATSVSGTTAPSRPNGTAPPRPPPSVAAKSAPSPTKPAKIDDHLTPPSHEFLKWLSDSLSGLNSSVNVEEIMSMLLTFPMDPDPSTTEIISDLIYANSTTLDGRRFATDFVSRRKADATSRPKGTLAGGTSGKVVSIADVVKAQPKPTQPEWGGFKVVNKKKKGGRS